MFPCTRQDDMTGLDFIMNDLNILLFASGFGPRFILVPLRRMGMQCGMRRILSADTLWTATV